MHRKHKAIQIKKRNYSSSIGVTRRKPNNLEKKVHNNFVRKYYNSIRPYNSMIINSMLMNKNCHVVAVFKDHMINDYIDEFLKRMYTKKESFHKLPQLAEFYKNYSLFFCKPIFTKISFNNIIDNFYESHAELFYNQNLKNLNKKSKENIDDCNLLLTSSDNDIINDVSKSKIEKTIFNSTLKNVIENSVLFTRMNTNTTPQYQNTITLHEKDISNYDKAKFIDENSNNASLLNIIDTITKKKTKKKVSTIANKNYSKFLSYSNWVKKKNNINNGKATGLSNSRKSLTKTQIIVPKLSNHSRNGVNSTSNIFLKNKTQNSYRTNSTIFNSTSSIITKNIDSMISKFNQRLSTMAKKVNPKKNDKICPHNTLKKTMPRITVDKERKKNTTDLKISMYIANYNKKHSYSYRKSSNGKTNVSNQLNILDSSSARGKNLSKTKREVKEVKENKTFRESQKTIKDNKLVKKKVVSRNVHNNRLPSSKTKNSFSSLPYQYTVKSSSPKKFKTMQKIHIVKSNIF